MNTPGKLPEKAASESGHAALLPTLQYRPGNTLCHPPAEGEHPERPASEWKPGETIANLYEVLSILGEGGFGTVYQVRHRAWNHLLAVKSLRADLAERDTHTNAFIKECEGWVNLGLHPNIVTCYYVRTLGGLPRIFSEYMPGGSLEEWIHDNREAGLAEIIDMAIQALDGLAFAHGRGLVHRDIKPGNCLLNDNGILKLTDFGIASGLQAFNGGQASTECTGSTMIVSEGVVGTPSYMPPEQWEPGTRGTSGPWSDIYAFGVMLFEMCCGERPFDEGGEDVGVLRVRHLTAEPPDPCALNSAIPEELGKYILRCLEKNPDRRFSRCDDAREELAALYQSVSGIPYPRPKPHDVDWRADSLNNRAVSLMDLGLTDDALAAWDESLAADALHCQSIFNRALVRWRRGDIDDLAVLEALRHIKHEQPKTWEADYFIGLVHLERNDCTAAAEALTAALESSGQNAEVAATLTLARTHQAGGSGLVKTCPAEVKNTFFTNIAVNSDNRYALLGGQNGVDLWDSETGTVFPLAGGSTGALALSGDGTMLLIGSAMTGEVSVWNIATRKHVKSLYDYDRERIVTADISADASKAAYVTAKDAKIPRLWEIDSDRFLLDEQTLVKLKYTLKEDDIGRLRPLMQRPFTQKSLEEALRKFLGANRIPSVLRHSDRRFALLEGHKDKTTAVRFFPDSQRVLTASLDGTLRIWNSRTKDCTSTMVHGEPILDAVLNSDGSLILSMAEKTVKIWTPGEAEPLRIFRTFHRGSIKNLHISSDWFATGGDDQVVKFHRLDNGRCQRSFEGVGREYGISPDGSTMIDSARMREARLWTFNRERFTHAAGFALSRIKDTGTISDAQRLYQQLLEQGKERISAGDWPGAMDALSKAREIEGFEREPEGLRQWQNLYRRCGKKSLHAAWCRLTIDAHDQRVASLSIDGRGKRAASGGDGGTIILWDIDKGEAFRLIDGNWGAIRGVHLSDDGKFLLSGHSDGIMRLWNSESGECIQQFRTLNASDVECVFLSHDMRFALSGSQSGLIQYWDVNSGTCLREYLHPERYWKPLSLSMDRSGQRLLSCKSSVKVWDLQTGAIIATLKEQDFEVSAFHMSPDGRWALTAGVRGSVSLWDLNRMAVVKTITGHGISAGSLTLSPCGRWAASGGRSYAQQKDNAVRLWDFQEGRCIRTMEGHSLDVTGVHFSPDSSFIITSGDDKTIRIWALDWDLEAPSRQDMTAGEVLSATATKIPALLKPKTVAEPETLVIEETETLAMEEPETLVMPAPGRKSALNHIKPPTVIKAHETPLTVLRIDDSGQRIATGGADGVIKIWDRQGNLLSTAGKANDWKPLLSCAFIHDGRLLATGHGDGTIALWESSTGALLKSVEAYERNTSVLSLAADDQQKRLLSAGRNLSEGSIKYWDIENWQCIERVALEDRISQNAIAALLPEGQGMVIADGEFIRIREARGRERKCAGHVRPINALAISTDQRWGITGSPDRTVRIWNLSEGTCVAVFMDSDYGSITATEITADGIWAFMASPTAVCIWNVVRQIRAGICCDFKNIALTSLAVSPDGFTLYTGHQDGSLRCRLIDWICDEPGESSLELVPSDMSGREEDLLLLRKAEKCLGARDLNGAFRALQNVGNRPGYRPFTESLALWKKVLLKGRRRGQRKHWPCAIAKADGIKCTALAVGSFQAITGGQEGLLRVWQIPEGICKAVYGEGDGWGAIRDILLSEDEKTAVVLCEGAVIRHMDMEKGQCMEKREIKGAFGSMALSADGKTFAAVPESPSDWRTIDLWHLSDTPARLTGHLEKVETLAMSEDGASLLSCDESGVVKFWDLSALVCLATHQEKAISPRRLALSRGGEQALWGNDRILRYWDRASGTEIKTLTLPDITGRCTSSPLFYPGDHCALSGMQDTIRFWNLQSGMSGSAFIGHSDEVTMVRMSPDGLFLIGISADRVMKIWAIEWHLDFPLPKGYDEHAVPFIRHFISSHGYSSPLRTEALERLIENLEIAGFGWMDGGKILQESERIRKELAIEKEEQIQGYPLHRAASEGSADRMQALLIPRKNCDTRDGEGLTALYLASREGHEAAVRVLADHGAALDYMDRQGMTPLMAAARAGHDGVLKILIDRGACISLSDSQGLSALHHAAEKGRSRCCSLLLTHGADVDSRALRISPGIDGHMTPLHLAAGEGDSATIVALLDGGADIEARSHGNYSPLHKAAGKGIKDSIELLLKRGADVDARDNSGETPLHKAARSGHHEGVAILTCWGADIHARNDMGDTPLHLAAAHVRAAEILIRRGALVNLGNSRDLDTPLHYAARSGNDQAVALLLKYGADEALTNMQRRNARETAPGESPAAKILAAHPGAGRPGTLAPSDPEAARKIKAPHKDGLLERLGIGGLRPIPEGNIRDEAGRTALHREAANKNTRKLRELLEKGGNPNIRDEKGRTPLFDAAGTGNTDAVRLMLDAFANPGLHDCDRETALHGASSGGHLEIVKLLLDRKAPVNACSRTNTTPLHEAVCHNHVEVVKLLLERGADPMIRNTGYGTPLQAAQRMTAPADSGDRAARAAIANLLIQAGAHQVKGNHC